MLTSSIMMRELVETELWMSHVMLKFRGDFPFTESSGVRVEHPDEFAAQRLDPRCLVESGVRDEPDIEVGGALGHTNLTWGRIQVVQPCFSEWGSLRRSPMPTSKVVIVLLTQLFRQGC